MSSLGKDEHIIILFLIGCFTFFMLFLYLLPGTPPTGGKDTPKGALQCTGVDDEGYTISVVEMNPTIGVSGASWYLYDQNEETIDHGIVADIYWLIEGDVTFYDNDRDGKVSPEDFFIVKYILSDGTKIQEGYKLSLKFEPLDDIVCVAIIKGNPSNITKPQKPSEDFWYTFEDEENNTISMLCTGIFFSHEPILKGWVEIVNLKIIIHNNCTEFLSNVKISFFDGEEKIQGDKIISIAPGENVSVNQNWALSNNIKSGTHTIKVKIDLENITNETRFIFRDKIMVIECITVVNSFCMNFEIVLLTIMITTILSFSNKRRRFKK